MNISYSDIFKIKTLKIDVFRSELHSSVKIAQTEEENVFVFSFNEKICVKKIEQLFKTIDSRCVFINMSEDKKTAPSPKDSKTTDSFASSENCVLQQYKVQKNEFDINFCSSYVSKNTHEVICHLLPNINKVDIEEDVKKIIANYLRNLIYSNNGS